MTEPHEPSPATRPAPRRYREEVVPFESGDGLRCNLVRVRGPEPPTRGPVLLVHGAGVRAGIFRAPVETTVVDALVADGYDVWLENWRASIDLPPNRWTLDQAAVHDHPRAVEAVVRKTGATEVKAVVHCQGSTSFVMSAMAGLVPQVSTIVSNAVSLHTVVPRWSRFKLRVPLPVVGRLFDYLNPQWGRHAPTLPAKLLSGFIALTHHECDNPVCKQVSFTYGSGFPALWSHEQLNPATHAWLSDEFAHVPMSFFRQIAACVRRGSLVSVDGHPALPADFAAAPPRTEARFALFAGAENRCFLAESQERTFDHLERHRPGYHSLHVVPRYGHLDMFMGKDAARDVFPLMLAELNRPA